LRTSVLSRPASWPQPGLELRRAVPAAAVGALLFLVSWGLLHVGPLARDQIVDTPVYQRYGDAILAGEVPYRDFSLEYPPGALPVFVLPSLAPAEHYRSVFEALMIVCGLGAVALVAAALTAARASPERLYGGCVLAGLAPLALGSVILTRFDLWPALLTVGALAAFVADRERLGFAALGLAAAAKVYPIVLLPLALVYVARRKGGRETVVGLAVFLAVLAVILVPFAILAPDGLAESLSRQTGRPLQIESLGSSFLLAASDLGSYEPTVVSSFGSQNLTGTVPDAVATALTALQAIAVVAVWVLFAARAGWREELLAASAAAVCVFAALGKVLSPQFLIWLIPLVPLVLGRRGLAAAALFVLALALTQLWFPRRYWNLVALEPGPIWLLVARDLVLVALAAALVAAIPRGPERSRSP
jgi:hypothetical protein